MHYRPPQRQSRHQKGSVLIQFSLLALVLLTILAVVQIGYMYSTKRDLQRIADLAALEAVNGINRNAEKTACMNTVDAGANSIEQQWPLGVTPQAASYSAMVDCGAWDSSKGYISGGSTFTNATRITLTGQSLQLVPFTGNRLITAEATAAIPNDAIASFSIGAGVARLDKGPLNNFLSMLLGTKVTLSAADYNGLANSKINLLGFKNAVNLGAGTYDELLATTVTMKHLLETSIDLASKSHEATADVAVNALDKILTILTPLDLSGTTIHLLKNGVQKGLVDLGLNKLNPDTALNADVSALNLLLVGLQIANKDSALKLSNTGINLKPLADIELEAKIIEPPVIATGKSGIDSNGKYITTAHSGQIRAFIKLKALTVLGGKSDLLNLNIPLVASVKVSLPAGQAIELPIYVEIGSADGRLEDIRCHAQPNTHRVRIGAKPGLAYAFLGNASEAMSNTGKPWTDLKKDLFHLLNLKVQIKLLLNLIPLADATVALKAKLDIPIENKDQYQPLSFDYALDKPASQQDLIKSVGSQQYLGASIGNAIDRNLLELELDTSGLKLLGLDLGVLSAVVDGLVNNLVSIVTGLLPVLNLVLKPVLALLDGAVLGPLLSTLGLQIGYADVQLLWADCNQAQLVN